ncbi:hypothetical protein CRUP_004933 [Coryphaenoides rupestris]|nr:hypothetical protein CRUP_004933 [Coryphaenoides rupestris]
MSTWTELQVSLDASLREVFGAAVSDVLAAVERSVAAWQERAARAEAHNTQLRRLLLSRQHQHHAAVRPLMCSRLSACGFCSTLPNHNHHHHHHHPPQPPPPPPPPPTPPV